MKYLILRRIVQISILVLYFGANAFGWKVLEGNLSGSLLLGTVPLADPYAILQMFVAGATLAADVLIGALIIALFYGIIGGRAFCSWVCPVNMITDLANWLRRKLGISQVQKRVYMSRGIRFWVLGLSLILSMVMGVAAFELISPISMVHRGLVFGMGLGFGAIVVIFIFDLFVHENGWCGHICPLGGFYTLLSRFSLIRVRHDADKCTACMECKEVCPEKEVLFMVAKNSESVLMGECVNCGRCIDVCNDDALGFSIRSQISSSTKE
jgi:ferredoxin-type protein NapH